MKSIQEKNVLITGGAAGIGKLMAQEFLKLGANVILWDINPQKLAETESELSGLGAVTSYVVDVANPEMIREQASLVKKEVGKVDILINNAGIVVGRFFHEHSEQDITRTMDINAMAPMLITRAFLPEMMEQNSGHICTIASSAGLVSNPRMAVYAASKWAALGWSDSLRIEMQELKKDIRITSILPYYINTGMFDGVKSRLPILKPEKAARAIVKAIQKDKKIVTLPGYLYHLTRFSQGILSQSLFDWVMRHIFGIYSTMNHFVGHSSKSKAERI